MNRPFDEHVSVVVTAPDGLHARPAIKLSRLAKGFGCDIHVRADGAGEWVDAKSLVRLMALKVEEGSRLELSADGPDARQALAEMSALVTRNFENDEAAEGG